MPLIRYDTGDRIWFKPDGSDDQVDRIQRGSAPFQGVLGRDSDTLVSPEGTTLVGIDHLARGLVSVARMQVDQRELDQVIIRLMPRDRSISAGDLEKLDEHIAAKIPASISVTVEQTDDFVLSSSGKSPFVIRSDSVNQFRAQIKAD